MGTLAVATPLDTSGSGLLGQLLALAAIVTTLVLLLRWWFQNRNR